MCPIRSQCCTNYNAPTGALDSKTGRTVMDLFHELNRSQGKTIVLITHSTELAEETDRIITISDGTINRNRSNPFPATILCAIITEKGWEAMENDPAARKS